MSNFVAFDLETTGLSAKKDRIIEIGAVRFDGSGQILSDFSILVNPSMPIPLTVERLTGINDRAVRDAPTPTEAIGQFVEFCEDCHLIAHGAKFDLAFCTAVAPQVFSKKKVIDTLDLVRILRPTAPSHSLSKLSQLLEIDHDSPHRAKSDAWATGLLFLDLIKLAQKLPSKTMELACELLRNVNDPTTTFFNEVISLDKNPALSLPADPEDGLSKVQTAPVLPNMEGDLIAKSLQILGQEGPLAKEVNYEWRGEQIKMTTAVAQSLDRGQHLLVEAGTGVGKSYAYLVPLVLWAQERKKRVVVATNTVTLQEQLANRDLVKVNQMLPSPVTYSSLKGRNHYISLRRWGKYLARTLSDSSKNIEQILFTLRILVWLGITKTGDKAELRLGGNESRYWHYIESQTEDCLGIKCLNWQTERCYMVAARKASDKAELIITNHAIVLADTELQGQVLKPYDAIVIDEAHNFEAAATKQLSISLKAVALCDLLDRVELLENLSIELNQIEHCRLAVSDFFSNAKSIIINHYGREGLANVVLTLSANSLSEKELTSVDKSVYKLTQTIVKLIGDLTDVPVEQDNPELNVIKYSMGRWIGNLQQAVNQQILNQVSWFSIRSDQVELNSAPIQVSTAIREGLLAKVNSAILTSATLSTADSLEFVKQNMGITSLVNELIVYSSFDYWRQAQCLIPTDMPLYTDQRYLSALANLCSKIASRIQGKTLVLFTNHESLRKVYSMLKPKLEADDIAVIGQGIDGGRNQTLASFIENSRAVLLGTGTFWEGIDLPGDVLKCVIITKLPFPVPSDPLIQAKSATLSDPFSQLVLPIAILKLKQGFGRLIRTASDRGVVVICDARMSTKEYGEKFIESLPKTEIVYETSKDIPLTVERFLYDKSAI